MQLADELPMIYTTCIMAYATFSYKRSPSIQGLVGLGLTSLATWITYYYLTSMDPVFHQVAYGLLTCALVFRNMYVMEAHLRPAMEKRTGSAARGDEILKQMWNFAFTGKSYTRTRLQHGWSSTDVCPLGIGLFLLGFAIWIFDNTFCSWLRSTRDLILLPWAALLEAHGWWHVFTGLGAYYWLNWRIWLETCLDGREGEFMLSWPSVFTSVPRIVPRPGYVGRAKTNGYSNGHANGKGHAEGLNGSAKKGN